MSGIVGSSHNIRGSGVVAKLGTDGQVFTSAGAGLKQTFEAAPGGGKVNQVIQTVDTTLRSTSSGSLVTTGISVTITPSADDSRVMLQWDCGVGFAAVMWGQFVPYVNVGGAGIGAISTPGSKDGFRVFSNNAVTPGAQTDNVNMGYLHSPASTSEHVYTMYWHTQGNIAYIGQLLSETETFPVFFTAIEILA